MVHAQIDYIYKSFDYSTKTLTGPLYKEEYTYNADGTLATENRYDWNGTSYVFEYHMTYTYYSAAGRVWQKERQQPG